MVSEKIKVRFNLGCYGFFLIPGGLVVGGRGVTTKLEEDFETIR